MASEERSPAQPGLDAAHALDRLETIWAGSRDGLWDLDVATGERLPPEPPPPPPADDDGCEVEPPPDAPAGWFAAAQRAAAR